MNFSYYRTFGTKPSLLCLDKPENKSQSILQPLSLHPWFITGFADGRASFLIKVRKDAKMGSGYRVELIFSFTLPKEDLALLKLIQSYFGGVGRIGKHGQDRISYMVSTLDDLSAILTHFDNYPLLTQLSIKYELFSRAFSIIKHKGHLTSSGIEEIISLNLA